MAERADFIRQQMRATWGKRARHFATFAAPQSSRYADVLIAKVRPAPGARVLDIAAGSGVLAVRAAKLVGPTGSVVATDLAPEWEEIVAETCAEAGVSNVTFRTMGAESLDFPDGSFDLALCQFGLMFVPVPVQALREMHRVLRDGGRIGITVWSTGDRVACFGVDRVLGKLAAPPDDGMPTPLSLGEPGLIERDVAAAGFRDIVAAHETLDHVIEDVDAYWQARVEMAPPHLAAVLTRMSPAELRQAHDDVVAWLDQYRQGDVIRLPSTAIMVTAVR